jgi:hypothetical protein
MFGKVSVNRNLHSWNKKMRGDRCVKSEVGMLACRPHLRSGWQLGVLVQQLANQLGHHLRC